MAQLSKIIKGWRRVASGLTTEQDKERATICSECPSAFKSKFMSFIDDELKEIEGFVCGECGCPLSAKIRSEDSCPLKKF